MKELREATVRPPGSRSYRIINQKAFEEAMVEVERMLDDHRFEKEQRPR